MQVTLDGRPVSRAAYGFVNRGPHLYWPKSTDPDHPRIGFRAQVDASAFAPGRHWLGLRLHGRDGSVEEWSETSIDIHR